jgi:putative aminopeptidase FrvX
MASRSTATQWLDDLTHLPTASGYEDAVIGWVKTWVKRRSDLLLKIDSGGNLLITQRGRKKADPVFAVAHMDHPAFLVTAVEGRKVTFEFRGGVDAEYFSDARVEFSGGQHGKVVAYDGHTKLGEIRAQQDGVVVNDIVRWKLKRRESSGDRFFAPACDDLAGCAAALAALDRARGQDGLRHFGVLLTRAEEVGLVGATHAAKNATIPRGSRLFSIETSRALANAPIGGGPIVRVGDAVTVFDADLTNRICSGAVRAGLKFQRKLMDGGACEATAFVVYGYRATGLCLALGNWHNRGNLDQFEAGTGKAVPMLEEISLSDFHGLVDLLLVACLAVDKETGLDARFDDLYDNVGKYLSQSR